MGNCFKRAKPISQNKNHYYLPSSEPTQITPIPYISLKRTNQYVVQYPVNGPRKETAIYRQTHKELIYNKNIPCFICGRHHLEKVDGKNVHLETHHFFCTKAAQNAVDWTAFGNQAKYFYNLQTGENIGAAFNWDEVAENPTIFVDSPQNMVVLCKKHHISGKMGIHNVPFPNWILQKFPKNKFQFLV